MSSVKTTPLQRGYFVCPECRECRERAWQARDKDTSREDAISITSC